MPGRWAPSDHSSCLVMRKVKNREWSGWFPGYSRRSQASRYIISPPEILLPSHKIMKIESLSITVSDSIGQVSGETLVPANPRAMLVLAHGAGADMNHRFMKALAKALAELDVATFRFNFPFMEKKKGRPDPPAI